MFKELGERVESAVLEGIGRSSARWQERTPLKVDLLESDDAYLAVFDAPGVRREDVEVRFDENTVFVRVDRFREFYDDYEMRLPGRGLSLDGSVDLPADADVDAREADATVTQNGTLRVHIPKTESGREVTVGDESVPHDTADEDATGAAESTTDTDSTADVGSDADTETGLSEEEIPDGPEDDEFDGVDSDEQ
ncbi:Hsp20/alpha crystallin family protein [Halomarina rubra]|uniref:Hsp20/alpha crystallin family protein n=1 Tax=Halomarina rubra TaxID=2071873 RepID=A0ABD6AUQ9_9EURY|nr:Hsp20/alpha crystallin family protein [Halomarina rubra]